MPLFRMYRTKSNLQTLIIYSYAKDVEESRALVKKILDCAVPKNTLLLVSEFRDDAETLYIISEHVNYEALYAPNNCLYYYNNKLVSENRLENGCLQSAFSNTRAICYRCNSTMTCFNAVPPHSLKQMFEKMRRVVRKDPYYVNNRLWHRLIRNFAKSATEALLQQPNWKAKDLVNDRIIKHLKETKCKKCLFSQSSITPITHKNSTCVLIHDCTTASNPELLKKHICDSLTKMEVILLLTYLSIGEYYYPVHSGNARWHLGICFTKNKQNQLAVILYKRMRNLRYCQTQAVPLEHIGGYIISTATEIYNYFRKLKLEHLKELFLIGYAIAYLPWKEIQDNKGILSYHKVKPVLSLGLHTNSIPKNIICAAHNELVYLESNIIRDANEKQNSER